jgi:hypothetical protein
MCRDVTATIVGTLSPLDIEVDRQQNALIGITRSESPTDSLNPPLNARNLD